MGCATTNNATRQMETKNLRPLPPSYELNALSEFPSTEDGYQLGVSACYAGIIGNTLIMAGGCNFPEPGRKRYYQGIYAADITKPHLEWQLIGRLPEPAAYGVSVGSADSLVFAGGNNADHSLSTVMSIHFVNGKAVVRLLPSLPFTADNFAGALTADSLFVFGGNQDGIPSSSLWHYDIHSGRCTHVGNAPGKPRVQPVCAAVEGKVYLWGGFFADGESSVVHTDGYCFNPHEGTWNQLPSASALNHKPSSLTLSGGTCAVVGTDIICLGGVNKDIFLDAISGRYQFVAKEDYLKKDPSWYRFNPHLMSFDTRSGRFHELTPSSSRLARAGAAIVAVPSTTLLYYIGGETKPSVRTNIIEQITLNR